MAWSTWTRHFLAAKFQYILTINIYQVYKSEIQLAGNGAISNCRMIWHLDMRFFYGQDPKRWGEGWILSYTRNDMRLLHKPLQEALLTHMQAKILNLPHSTSIAMHRSVLKNQKYYSKKNEQKKADDALGVILEVVELPEAEATGFKKRLQESIK